MNDYAALITGGAGFIGSHLTEKLTRESYKVTILDNLRARQTSSSSSLAVSMAEEDGKEMLKKCSYQ